jgi:hypothetical protein
MSYDKSDFIVLKNSGGVDVLVNISRIQFIIEAGGGMCNIFFGPAEDDYVIVKCTIDDFRELL